MSTNPIVRGGHHVGLYAVDPKTLAEFYQAVLGLHIVGLSDLTPEGIHHSVFLSDRLEAEHHQLAIFANPQHQHVAFEVDSLADLRALNHGESLAFYFADPADNLIKLYWPTGVACPQPHGHPIDLSQPEAALRKDVADLVTRRTELKGGGV